MLALRTAIAVPLTAAISAAIFAVASLSPFDPLAAYLGGNYQFGATTLGALYTDTRFNNAVATTTTTFQGAATLDSYEAFVSHNFTPAVMAGLTYDYTSSPHAHYNQVAAGSQYAFSKRTFTYLIVAWQRASGVDSTGHAAVADLTYLSPSSTPNQVAVRLGIRHNF